MLPETNFKGILRRQDSDCAIYINASKPNYFHHFVTMADSDSSRPSRRQPIFEEGMTEAVEIKLIEFFKENPFLYDKSHENFKRRDLKDRLLTEKAEELRGLGLRPCDPGVMWRWFRSTYTHDWNEAITAVPSFLYALFSKTVFIVSRNSSHRSLQQFHFCFRVLPQQF